MYKVTVPLVDSGTTLLVSPNGACGCMESTHIRTCICVLYVHTYMCVRICTCIAAHNSRSETCLGILKVGQKVYCNSTGMRHFYPDIGQLLSGD